MLSRKETSIEQLRSDCQTLESWARAEYQPNADADQAWLRMRDRLDVMLTLSSQWQDRPVREKNTVNFALRAATNMSSYGTSPQQDNMTSHDSDDTLKGLLGYFIGNMKESEHAVRTALLSHMVKPGLQNDEERNAWKHELTKMDIKTIVKSAGGTLRKRVNFLSFLSEDAGWREFRKQMIMPMLERSCATTSPEEVLLPAKEILSARVDDFSYTENSLTVREWSTIMTPASINAVTRFMASEEQTKIDQMLTQHFPHLHPTHPVQQDEAETPPRLLNMDIVRKVAPQNIQQQNIQQHQTGKSR